MNRRVVAHCQCVLDPGHADTSCKSRSPAVDGSSESIAQLACHVVWTQLDALQQQSRAEVGLAEHRSAVFHALNGVCARVRCVRLCARVCVCVCASREIVGMRVSKTGTRQTRHPTTPINLDNVKK